MVTTVSVSVGIAHVSYHHTNDYLLMCFITLVRNCLYSYDFSSPTISREGDDTRLVPQVGAQHLDRNDCQTFRRRLGNTTFIWIIQIHARRIQRCTTPCHLCAQTRGTLRADQEKPSLAANQCLDPVTARVHVGMVPVRTLRTRKV